MKQDKHRFLRKRRGRKPGKAGSSLALVMMIGAALVIWVMCIMPLMTTTGTTAIQTEEKYDDYLESRSSIEYCKSELENIVKSEIPYNFCVIKDPANNDKFKAIRRNVAGSKMLSDEYKIYVDTSDATEQEDATHDKPQSGDKGNQVTAICVVKWNTEKNHYDITIKTYHNGEPGQTYSLIYTLNGSLLIYPESYKQNQALPLSDFVVVDGIMGGKYNEAGELVANKIWKSDINMGNAVSGSGTGGFSEELLPWVMEPSADYANSQEYPAVFKKTAEAALLEEGGSEVGTPITDGDFTDEVWVEPKTDGTKTTPGYTWIETSSDGAITVYLNKDGSRNITDSCTIYLNGEKSDSKKVPTQEGYYTVTIDYEGDSDAKILPVSGLRMVTSVDTVETHMQTMPNSSIKSVVLVDNTYTVTMSGDSDVRYGYHTQGENEVHWNSIGSFEFQGLEADKTYYFYAYRPAAMVDDGNGYVYKSNSNVQYVGRIFPKKFATELTNGGQYLVLGKNGNDYSAMTVSGNNLSAVSLSGKGIKVNGEFFIQNGEGSVDNNLKWTVQRSEKSNSKWSFRQGEGDYLAITGYYDYGFFGIGARWVLSAGVATEDFQDVGFVNQKFGQFSISHYFKESKRNNITAYLSIADNFVSAQKTQSYVYFLNLPEDEHRNDVTAPTVTGSLGGNGMVYAINNNVLKYVGDHGSWTMPDGTEGSDVTVNAVYANGTKCIYETEAKWLNAGEYYLTADITVDGTQYFVELGRQAVGKGSLPTDLSIQPIVMDDNDELKVKVTATGWNIDNDKYVGGTRWFGYQKLDDNGNHVEEFKWYPANGVDPVTSDETVSYTFRLPYGTYNFAVREYGSNNYNGVDSEPMKKTIAPIPVTLSADQINEFVFTYNKQTNTTVWYKLPMATVSTTADAENAKKIQILPCRVKLVFGTPGDNGTSWFDTLTDDARYYGVKITASNYEETPLQLSQPIGITNVGGRTSSMMRGKSLYFMGQDASINTYGNSIYLTTDVLVLGSDITGGGSVIVSPYSSGTDKCTLFFNAGSNIERVNSETGVSTVVFKSRYLYKLKPNADLCNPTFGDYGKVEEIGSISNDTVRELFKKGTYDEPNLDIAYASDEQLAHIISSETIGWTKNGILSGVDNNNREETNKNAASYVVCAYVNQINANDSVAAAVSRRANRVMLVGRTFDGISALNVPCSLTFDTRYLSIDAQTIVQIDSGASFNINNLGQDEDFLQLIIKELGVSSYHSKTLQVDYEQPTTIKTVSYGEKLMKQQICRYGITVNGSFVGADLFGLEDDAHKQNKAQPLMVTYTTDEINGWFSTGENAEFNVKVVDRYVSIVPDGKNGSKKIKINASAFRKLDLYANYIYFGPTVEEISLYTGINQSKFNISSQESGYTTNDYLGLFKTYSADSYNGTMIYIANPKGINCQYYYIGGYKARDPIHIEPGFYYIPAKKEGTTSITELANPKEPIVKVPESELSKYSVYIDRNGNMSNSAFVDPGIYDNTATGTGGFSGGNVG